MDRPTSTQLNPIPNGLSNFQGNPSAESGATGQAFSRMVAEVEQPVTNHDITDQSTSSDNQGYLNPEKKCLKDFNVQNPTSDNDSSAIPAAISINQIEPVKNNQVPEYIPENNPFSIYSITKDVQSTSQYTSDVVTNLNQPIQNSNQGGIGIPSESSVPMVIISPFELQQNKPPAIQAEDVIDENSSHIERQRKRQRDRYQKDTVFAERQRKRQRDRYQKDTVFAERQRKRQRDRYQKDTVFAEGQKIYNKTYNRIKKETSNKEEAKKQAVIARDQYLQSVNSAKNSGDLPLTSNLAETTQSSSKNLDGTAPPPLFSRQSEGIFTIPIEPISP